MKKIQVEIPVLNSLIKNHVELPDFALKFFNINYFIYFSQQFN